MQQALDKSFEFDVFICHSSKDKPVIALLIKELKKKNVTYWVDSEQIDFGDSITEKIAEGLETSKYVIPCISKNLKTSKWTRAEFGSMLNAEFSGNPKKIIPLLLDDCEDSDIPTLLRDKRRVIYSNKTEFNEFIKFLKKNQNEQKEIEDPLKNEKEGERKFFRVDVGSGVTLLDIEFYWGNESNRLSFTMYTPEGKALGPYYVKSDEVVDSKTRRRITPNKGEYVETGSWMFEVSGVSVSGTEIQTFAHY